MAASAALRAMVVLARNFGRKSSTATASWSRTTFLAHRGAFADATARTLSSPRGISGAAVRDSTRRKPPTSARPAASGSRVAAAVHPSASVCEMPYANTASPPVTSTAPGRSRRRPSPLRLSVSHSSEPSRTSEPTGTLISSTQRQDRVSTRSPPTNPPAAPPPAPTAVQVAMARARAAPSGTADVTMVSVAGASTAAPSPCTARAISSWASPWASPPASEAAVNRPRPTRNIRLRP
ncbi:hypothetical protein QFZ32_006452 [Streptomyces canus]|nr:hypothetical protein [Streptomyces canus]